MKSILTTYPDFQRLPKGVKQMLLESETFFFHEFEPAARIESHSRPEFATGLYRSSQAELRQAQPQPTAP